MERSFETNLFWAATANLRKERIKLDVYYPVSVMYCCQFASLFYQNCIKKIQVI